MLWRSLRLPCLLPTDARLLAPRSLASLPSQARRASALSIKNPSIADILSIPAQNEAVNITVSGSVRTVRNQKHRCFLELGDGSTSRSLQAILLPTQAEGLTTGAFVQVSGSWGSSPDGKKQTREIKAENVTIIGDADAKDYPIQKKYHSAEYLRTLPHLRLRTPFNALLARLRSESDYVLANFFRSQGFVRLQPPLITSSDCEGAGEVFTVSANSAASASSQDRAAVNLKSEEEFFNTPKYLTVSSQLHLEAFVHEHQKVWAFSPTFRAEKSDTSRHVSEFWMLEAEFRTESLEEVMTLVENMIQYLATHVCSPSLMLELSYAQGGNKSNSQECTNSLDEIKRRRDQILAPLWPRITYQDAIERLKAAVESEAVNFQYVPSWELGLQLEHEKYLAATIGKGSPVFVTNYPANLKPFYMLPLLGGKTNGPTNKQTVACFDLLMPKVCEIVGGSLREHRLSNLTEAMLSHGLNLGSSSYNSPTMRIDDGSQQTSKGNLDWYLDLRRFGSVPHGGFGLGFDRLLGYLAGVSNIKDVVPWPRYYGRCDC